MIIDALQQFSGSSQALSGAGSVASTDVIDLGQERRIGNGEPMQIVVVATVALAGTSPTLQVTLQSDDNSGFASPASVAQSASLSALAAGGRVVVPVPQGALNERYIRLNYTLGGTSPSVTVKAFLQPVNMTDAFAGYPSGYVIS